MSDKPQEIHEILGLSGEKAEKLYDLLYDRGWESPEDIGPIKQENADQAAEIERLENLLNCPLVEEFIEAAKNEAAHQRWRWGDDHDMRKTAGEWFWTLGYLAQKAMIAAESGDRKKALHHAISSAALLANWHRQISRFVDTGEKS